MQCELEFSKCSSANRLKYILNGFKKILSDKSDETSAEFEKSINELLRNTLANDQYSDIKLMNDFYHIKYTHNTNDDTRTFTAFYEYLCANSNRIKCDFAHCKGVKRHFNGRQQVASARMNRVQNKPEEEESLIVQIMDRIHTYFIHSHDLSKLSHVERRNIENNNKYIETTCEDIDCDKIASALTKIGFDINANDLQTAFDDNQYNMKLLVSDLCDICINKKTNDTQLSSIIRDALLLEETAKQQQIYDAILCCGVITKRNLNHLNFVKILQISAFKVNRDLNLQDIEQIASDKHLNGNIFINNTPEFMNGVTFGALFQSIAKWDKKQWNTIYLNIQKWTFVTTKVAKPKDIQPKQHFIVESDNDHKYDENDDIDYIERETDVHILQTFCTLTSCSKQIALIFLQRTAWNIDVAIDRYFRFNGNITALYVQDNNHNNNITETNTEANTEEISAQEEDLIYNDGVAFWYWTNNKENKRYVVPKHDNLKDELLSFIHIFSIRIWNNIKKQCELLLNVDDIKQITSNGHNSEIYGINSGDPITLKHLISIKLYTDCTTLCGVFCKTFRLKRILNNYYERMESLMRRNSKVANWTRLLMESVQSFGSLRVSKTKYFRGIDSEFVFKRFITRYNAPLSTTYDLQKAMTFSADYGIVMVLKVYNEYAAGLNVFKVSAYPNEKEVFFFGATLRLSSLCHFDQIWNNYRAQIEGIQSMINIANGSIKWNRKNNLEDIIGHILPHLYRKTKPLPSYIVSLLDYHLRSAPKRIEYDFRELSHQYTWVQHIFLKDEHIPNIRNACNLFKYSNHIMFIMKQDYVMDDKCCKSVMKDIITIINRNITIQLQWPSAKELEDVKATLLQLGNEEKTVDFIVYIPEPGSIIIKSKRADEGVIDTNNSKATSASVSVSISNTLLPVANALNHKLSNRASKETLYNKGFLPNYPKRIDAYGFDNVFADSLMASAVSLEQKLITRISFYELLAKNILNYGVNKILSKYHKQWILIHVWFRKYWGNHYSPQELIYMIHIILANIDVEEDDTAISWVYTEADRIENYSYPTMKKDTDADCYFINEFSNGLMPVATDLSRKLCIRKTRQNLLDKGILPNCTAFIAARSKDLQKCFTKQKLSRALNARLDKNELIDARVLMPDDVKVCYDDVDKYYILKEENIKLKQRLKVLQEMIKEDKT